MNTKVYNALPRDKSLSPSYAAIARLDGKSIWEFLLLPTEIKWAKAASYQASNTAGNIPIAQYNQTSPWVVSLSVPLYTGQPVTLTEYAEKLSALLIPENGAPPLLSWQWGQRKLSPCVMTQCDRAESNWSKDGQILSCRLDIQLSEVSQKLVV